MNSTRSETQSSHTYVQDESRTAQESQPQPSSYTRRLNRYVDSVPVASQRNVEEEVDDLEEEIHHWISMFDNAMMPSPRQQRQQRRTPKAHKLVN
jgi:hypothetical protein